MQWDEAFDVEVDDAGNRYLAGFTLSRDFPQARAEGPGGIVDAFVAKVAADGTLAWSVALGGTDLDTATSIALDLGAPGGGKRLAEQIGQRGITVDVLVNNAGYGHAGALTSSDLDTQLGMIDLNDRALVELTYLFWDGIHPTQAGHALVAHEAARVLAQQ